MLKVLLWNPQFIVHAKLHSEKRSAPEKSGSFVQIYPVVRTRVTCIIIEKCCAGSQGNFMGSVIPVRWNKMHYSLCLLENTPLSDALSGSCLFPGIQCWLQTGHCYFLSLLSLLGSTWGTNPAKGNKGPCPGWHSQSVTNPGKEHGLVFLTQLLLWKNGSLSSVPVQDHVQHCRKVSALCWMP